MRVVIEYDVCVVTSDGVSLATDLFRPEASGRYPVIVVRTPYGKLSWPWGLAMYGADPLALARVGYVVVLQDARGTGTSGGTFRPLRDEGRDGAATIAWAAEQPWSNGAVATVGPSYLGAVQLLAAAEQPPALRAVAPFVASGPESLYRGGAFRLGMYLAWAVMMTQAQLDRREHAGEEVSRERAEVEALASDLGRAYRRLPLLGSTPVLLDGAYDGWLRHPEGDDFWRATATLELPSRFATPALHIGGWYDHNLQTTLARFQALRAGAATEQTREHQRLIIGPWGHGPGGEALGEIWFGPGVAFDLFGAHLAWLDTWLKGAKPEGARVQLFVQGLNRWRSEDDWPLSRAVSTRWFLHAGGRLAQDAPGDAPPAEFAYDPRDLLPTLGGQGGVNGEDGMLAVGPHDRRALHARPDVLLYVSDPLPRNLEVTGPVTATLHIASSATDTDFTAALLDVYPDGRAIVLTDGILRLRYRDGTAPQLLEPGRVYAIDLDLVATSNVFRAGHRIGIEISSSNFPRFDRNPNHGGVIAEATESDFVVAVQKVFLDTNHASFLTLPVVRT